MRADNFVSHIESSFIESETQQKKIFFLQKELHFSEKYAAELERAFSIHNATIQQLTENRPNQEIFDRHA